MHRLPIEGNLNVLFFTGEARAAYLNRLTHRSRLSIGSDFGGHRKMLAHPTYPYCAFFNFDVEGIATSGGSWYGKRYFPATISISPTRLFRVQEANPDVLRGGKTVAVDGYLRAHRSLIGVNFYGREDFKSSKSIRRRVTISGGGQINIMNTFLSLWHIECDGVASSPGCRECPFNIRCCARIPADMIGAGRCNSRRCFDHHVADLYVDQLAADITSRVKGNGIRCYGFCCERVVCAIIVISGSFGAIGRFNLKVVGCARS